MMAAGSEKPQALSVMRLVIDNKADVNANSFKVAAPIKGVIALVIAARNGRDSAVQLLIRHRADVNAVTNLGQTALMYAAINAQESALRLLLEHRADVNAVDKRGETALTMATALTKISQNGHAGVVEALLARRADVNHSTTNGATPILIASSLGHAVVLKLLLAAGGGDISKSVTSGPNHGASAVRCIAAEGEQGSAQHHSISGLLRRCIRLQKKGKLSFVRSRPRLQRRLLRS
jgi:ankyrin repeat protein